jgi:hypothetical protein
MAGELAHAARGIPLHARDGSIRAFAMVDADLHPALARHRWSLHPHGYVLRYVGGRKNRRCERLHRRVLSLGDGDSRQVDHRNRNKLDNRRANLRTATNAENRQNQGSQAGSSRYRGVTWDKSREEWMAQAQLAGKHFHLGRFRSEKRAAEAAAAFRRQHMPFAID